MLYTGIAFCVCISFIAGMMFFSLSTAFAAPIAPNPNTEIVLAVNYDGTAPFSATDPLDDGQGGHTPGEDLDGSNSVVRTFDLIQYRIDWNVNEIDATNVVIEATLPAAIPEVVWEAIPPGCDPLTSTLTNNNQTLTCDLGNQHEGTAGMIQPIAEVGGTRSGIDGDVITVDATIDTAQTTPVTSNQVSTTISGSPSATWVKGNAKEYWNVTRNSDNEVGRVVVYPIFMKPVASIRGIEPINASNPIVLYDHLYALTTDTSAGIDATLLTSANVNSFSGYAQGRVCGGYDGIGDDQVRNPVTGNPLDQVIPYGVNGLGAATNTTTGAFTGSESWSCVVDTAASATSNYPVVEVTVSGYDVLNPPARGVGGAPNLDGITIAGQVAFWLAESELCPGAACSGHLHNAISGSKTPLPSTSNNIPSVVNNVISIDTVVEDTTVDNVAYLGIEKTPPPTNGAHWWRHWVNFKSGEYQQAQMYDPLLDLYNVGFDKRDEELGGQGILGMSDSDTWDFLGTVSRNQLVTINYGQRTYASPSIPYYAANNEAIHGCVYIDNTFMELVDFQPTFEVHDVQSIIGLGPTLDPGKPTYNTTLGTTVGTPSDGLAHVLYGTSTWFHRHSTAHPQMVRIDPNGPPSYVVEVAKSVTGVGASYARGDVQCNNDDADVTGWVDVNTGNLTPFVTGTDSDGRTIYGGIEMVRLRTLEPVRWRELKPTTILGDASRYNPTANYGHGFELFVQARVKPNVATAPDGSKISVHASRARSNTWDGTTDPPSNSCWTSAQMPSYATFQANPTGWCQLATDSTASGNASYSDPYEEAGNIYPRSSHIVHRDTITVDAPRLHVKKSNVAGLSDIVDNGDTVTFQIDLRITGAPVVADQLTNITITDTLPAHYEFVSFAALPATGSCNESNDVVVCTFGNQVSPWNDSLQITVKVQQAQANQVLDNRVTATAIRAAGGELVSDTSMAYAYMPDGYRELSLRKEVPDMLGPCIKPPGSTQQSADDCSLFDLNSIITYTLHYTNDSNLPISNTHLIDVFPFNGDTAEPTTTFIGTPAPAILPGIVGDGRTPPSNFAGTLALAAPPTVGSMAFTPAAVNFYYTAAPPATISRDPADAMHTFGAGQMWCTTADFGTGGNCPAALSTATALYAELGDVPVGSTNTITVTFQTNGNSTNNIYTNNFGARTLPNSTVALALPMRSNDVSAMPTGPEVNLGNQIWKDLNNNGLIDGGEQGIGSVEVELYQDTNGDGVYGPGDTLVMTTTTTATGHYTFTGLTPTQGINETYMVVLPSTNFVGGGALEGHHNSDGNGATAPDPDDDVDDDDNGTPSGTLGTPTGIVASQPIELTLGGEPSTDLEPNDSNYTVDFGFYQALSLGNQVWFDTNNNGQIDATEQGIDNVVVELYIDSDGNGVYTPGIDSYVDAVTTVAGGHYTFTELLDESYVVVIPSTNFSGAGALVDYHSSDPTEADPDADVDHNDNGLVSGTLGSGGYVSSGAIDLDFNQEPTTDGDADTFTNWTVDFGFYTMSLGNQVWEDLDNNGLLDPGESGISNVTVELLDAGGAVVDTTTTDPSGFYTFTGLISGTYSVRITTPSTDYVSSTPDAGDPDNDIDDSDDNGVGSGTGQITSDPITLIPGDSSDGSVSDDGDGSTENPLVDFGIWQPLNLGNRVWLDDGASADDGVLDGDENGIDGVTVELYDSNGALVGTTTTQNGGYYTFTGLISDTYEVLIPASNFGSGAPLEKLFSSSGNSSDDQDETVNENGIDDADPATNGISSAPVILSYNSEPTNDGDGDNGNLTIDFGFVYYDLALIKERSAGQGYALNFSTTPPTASFDILVENQGPADVNNVTVVESIPAGMRLVSVNGTPITPVTGTHTIAIPNIAAGSVATLPVIMEIYDLSYGAYTNIAEISGMENGNSIAVADIDSTADANPTNDLMDTSPGIDPNGDDDNNSHNDLDFGGTDSSTPGAIIDPATSGDEDDHGQEVVVGGLALGNRVWYDPNNNGLIDGGEVGIQNALVEVYAVDALGSPVGGPVGTDTTDANGYWLVDNLPPGDYIAVIPASNFAPGAALEDHISSTDIASSSTPNNDTESDDNGIVSGGQVASGIITLDPLAGEPQQGSGEGDLDSHGNAGDLFDNLTVDFGFTEYVSLGSTLFYDNDNNGQHDAGESTIDNIVVELLDVNGTVVMTTTTDSNGHYLFEELMPGDYQVRVPTAPSDAPTSSTPTSTADDNVDGDDNGTQSTAGGASTSPMITLTADGEPTGEPVQGGAQDAADDDNGDMTVDFGFVPPLSLGSTLFYDNDNNGQQGTGETGIAGLLVELLDSAGNVVATTTTDANGDYLFDNLLPGDYQVRIPTPPSGAPMSSTTTSTTDDDVDSDDNGDQSGGIGAPTISPMITLAVGSEPTNEPGQGGGLGTADDENGNMTIDFGFVPPLSLGSTLFYDNDNDGIQTTGETGIAGILVELYDTAGNLLAMTTTDSNGDYLFDGLLPGDYQVVIPVAPTDAPTSSTPTNMADDNVDGDDNGDQPSGAGAATTSPVITLAVDSEPTAETEQGGAQDVADDDNGDMTVDFGFAPYVSLGSTVFHDNNNNGLQDSNDAGIGGVTVELYDATGNLVATTTTDSNGDYFFGDLLPGDYQVIIPTPPANAPTSSTPTSMTDDNVDGDDNGDQPGGSGTATTSPMITLHADSEPTGEPGQGGNQDASDDDNGDMTVDFGFVASVSVGDLVWYDDNNDGQQNAGELGVTGVTVNLFDSAGNPLGSTTTDANGNYLFDNLPPGDYYVVFDLNTLPSGYAPTAQNTTNSQSPATSDQTDSDAAPGTGQTANTGFLNSGESDLTLDMGIVAPVTVGDRVWYDDNRDGIQDAGETGVENVLAVLYDTTTGQPVTDQFGVPMIDLTDANGNYLFENLPPGDYYVEFQLNTLPTDYVVTQANQGSDDALDSDADPSTGVTAPTGFLPSNTEDLTLDMGIYRPEGVTVGDRVWLDSNRDGLQDPGEAGVPGVTATLVDSNGNPVTQDRDGNPIVPLVTDANGNYLFDNLPPGDYAVVFDLNTLPNNHLVTQQDAGSDDLLDSDVDPVTGMTPSTGPLDEDEQDLSLDMGIYPAGDVTVGDTVWFDDDFDGMQDSNEAGVPNVTVNLFDAGPGAGQSNPVTDMNGNPVGPTTTDSNGNYLFTNLPAGDYYVEFDLGTLPVGYLPTLQDATSNQSPATSDQSDSDADPANGQTASTGPLSDGEEDLTLDMGIVAPVSVGDTVWYDDDSDGMQDSGESGVAGVTVNLFDSAGNPVTDMAGNPVGPVVTDSNGNYTFDNLPPGDYYVQFDLSTLPGGYVPTAPNAGGNDAADSDASLSTGETPSTGFLPSGSEDMSLDMGIVQPAGVRVGDTVWYDDNINGVQDPGEIGVAGVTVELFNADGTPVTDMNGNPVGPTTTDANGNYLFDNLPAGDYYVQFDLNTLPTDSIVTLQDATNNQQPATSDQSDSDADPTTGESAPTGDLAAGEEDLTLDMGIYRPASIGDTVWEDLDADGVQDVGEPGIAGVIVELFNAGPGAGLGTPATDMNGNSMTTTTDANGNYLFDDLYPGDYYVEFTAPAGYDPSPQDAGSNDAADSDADPITGQTAVTTLSSGENDPTWDAGFYQPAPEATPTPEPTEAPTEEPTVVPTAVSTEEPTVVPTAVSTEEPTAVSTAVPTAEPTVVPTEEPTAVPIVVPTEEPTAIPTEEPTVVATPLPATPTATVAPTVAPVPDEVRVGDRVWYDNDGDGVQDSPADEPGVEDVTVTLYNADGTLVTDLDGNVVASVMTDADGNYLFDNLPEGDYYVGFDLNTIPGGYTVTEQDATNSQSPGTSDQSDSDGDPTTGHSGTTGFLPEGSEDLTLDLGIVAPVSVGDRVWYDYDGDGAQDAPADEPGVEGVTAILLNADGTPATDMNGNPVAPVVTDSAGNYLFENLPPGDYQVMFDLDTLPGNHMVTEQNATNNQPSAASDLLDSDGDPVTGLTDPTGPLMAGEEDLTLDLGILPIPPVEVGDTVWYDENSDGVQDAGEDGVEGMTVLLFNASPVAGPGSPVTDMDGNPVGPATTDANGNYLFENLPEGDYYIQFDLTTLPEGYEVTEQDAGSDDGADSDGDPDTGVTGATGFLPAGSSDMSLDLGISPVQPVTVGDTVWYDDNRDGIQDAGEAGVEDVTVTIFNADGTPVTDMDGNPVGPQTTDADGEYLFENLPPGGYFVQFDLDTLPQHYVVTEANAGSDDSKDSDASTSTGTTDSTGFLPGGSEGLTLGMGIVLIDPDVRVGDRVWLDEDRDGLQDAGEPGVEGVTVNLYDTVIGDFIGTTVTDADGNYLFDDLFPGDYYVQFDLSTIPGNHAVTEQNSGDDDGLDSDVSAEDGLSAPTGILFTGEEDMSLDMGIYLIDEVTVGDTVWYDSDSNGLQDAGELGVEGVTATLYDTTTGQPVAGVSPQQTDSNGNYLFEELPAGDYYVAFDLDTLPDGYGVTELNVTNGQTGPTGPLSGDESDLTLDMGIVQLPGVTVGDGVWYDDNGDGVQDPAEEGVAGITVYLYDEITGLPVTDAAGEPLMQVTDGDGEYLFTDLPPGQYSVQFDLDTLPDAYVVSPVDQDASDTADSDAGPDGMTTPTDVLASGDEDRTLDMGIYKPVMVGDTVWFDDGNGQQDGPRNGLGEEGVADVRVVLYDAETGEVVGTTTTDENGNYLFDNLPPGNYEVAFDLTSLPEGAMVTGRDMEGDDEADSDADPETGRTPETGFLSSGEADLSLDMGIVLPVSIGDRVWIDANMDGIQDTDEEGVADVTVTLYGADGNRVAKTTTDENGNYLFDELMPGDYSVGFGLDTLPEGYVVTQANATNDQSPATSDQTDSDASPDDGRTPSTGFLPSGSAVRDLDMGIHKPAQDEVRVGGQVWEDTNLDGEVDADEKVWPGITVLLYSQDDPTTPIATVMTDENGNYLFENLPPGEYFTKLDPESLPEGALPPSYYSAGSPDDLRANSGALDQGDEALELDMALRFPASLSGLAWLDANGDGIRSVDEEILNDVTVELYDATGEKVGEMQTDAAGAYLFDELTPGEYRILCPAVKAYTLSPNLQGEDDSRDSDINPATNESDVKFVGSSQHLPHIDLGLYRRASLTNVIWADNNGDGVQDEDEAGIAGIIVFLNNAAGEVIGETVTDRQGRYSFADLAEGQYYITFAAPPNMVLVTDVESYTLVRGPIISIDESNSGNSNISAIDIGFTQPAALGNFVWLDMNKDGLFDADEAGVAEAVVRLLDENGKFIAVTTTDSDGRFEFMVAPGTYQLQFIAKDGMQFTMQNQGDDARDSDVDTESGRTAMISIAAGETDFSHFAGLLVSPTAIQLMSLTATETAAGVAVQWVTGSELNTFGFQILRSRSGNLESAVEVTEDMVLAGSSEGVYEFIDTAARVGQVYSYWLVEVQNDQTVNEYGPMQVMVEGVRRTTDGFMLFLPLIQK